MFYCDLSGQVLAGDRQLWSSCGSVLLDQIEVNKGHLLPVQNNLLMVGWEGDWLQAAKNAFTAHKIF